MSEQTHAALEKAIADHIADVTQGKILTDFALISACTAMEDIGTGTTVYHFEGNKGQPPHVSYGLLNYALHSAVWDGDEDD